MNRFVALCSPGLESLPSQELRHLGIKILETSSARVTFEATAECLCRSLLGSRTVDRILWHIGDFRAPNLESLFEQLRDHPWEDYLPRLTFPVIEKVRLSQDSPHGAQVLQATVHKAMLQRLAKRLGMQRLPDYADKVFLRVYGQGERIEVGLDLTPQPLSHRGYRLRATGAPLRETVAASLVLWSGLKRGRPLCDPMCGTGTLIAESLLWFMDRAPNLNREFDLPPPLGIDGLTLDRARDYWKARETVPTDVLIVAADRDPKALRMAQQNLDRLGLPPGVRDKIRWQESELSRFQSPGPGTWLLTNPPWGERLEDRETAQNILVRLGALFKEKRLACLGLFSAQPDSTHFLNLARIQRLFFRNGGIPVQMLVAKAHPP